MRSTNCSFFMPRLGGAYCFRRVRSQRKSVDWGTMGPALGGAYECCAHTSSLLLLFSSPARKLTRYFKLSKNSNSHKASYLIIEKYRTILGVDRMQHFMFVSLSRFFSPRFSLLFSFLFPAPLPDHRASVTSQGD